MVHKTNSKQREIMQLTLPQAIDYYLTALTLESKSPATILWYRKKLSPFVAFMQDGGDPPKICSPDLEAVGQFKVFGKGAKERIVPMGLVARRAVIRYKENSRPQPLNPMEDRLFLTVAGDPVCRDSVNKIIQRLAKRAGIPRLHAHLLRCTFALRYLINGGDVFTLQKILGHNTLEMPRKYVMILDDLLRRRLCPSLGSPEDFR